MANYAQSGTRLLDYDGSFFRGAKSDIDPGQLPLGYFWSAINMINLGGVMSCRPGYRCVVQLPDGNLQGLAIFRPQDGLEQLVTAVDGKVYVAAWPYTNFRLLENIALSPSAKMVYWKQATQSAERMTEDLGSAVRVLNPRRVLLMQDGGLSAPAWYDGTSSGQVRGDQYGLPSGGPMSWVGDRLWVGVGNQVLASDIANPFSFREQMYLGGASSFYFSGDVTALITTPSIESPQLMAFTETNGSLLQANIRERSQWASTVNFQEEIMQVGCSSHRSAISHYGKLVWFSPSGVVFYDPALSGKITTRLPTRDNEMMVSKSVLSDDLGTVAAGTFGQFLMMSVPAADVKNSHTWVLNHASLETLDDSSGPSWCGYWTGTRPVEWVSGAIAGAERVFHVSADADGHNRLWEAFRPERLDNGCPIMWAMFSRGYFGQTGQSGKPPGARVRMAWADIALAAIAEDLDLGVFFAAGARGAFKQILAKKYSAERGSIRYDLPITGETPLFGLKPQARVARTQDANQQRVDDGGSVERSDLNHIDESFQLLVVGHGPATVRWIRPWCFLVPESMSGDPAAGVDEENCSAVRFDGVCRSGATPAEVIASLAATPPVIFHATKTVALTSGDLSGVGFGSASSVVSQRAADRVAERIATQRADMDLTGQMPGTLSQQTGLE